MINEREREKENVYIIIYYICSFFFLYIFRRNWMLINYIGMFCLVFYLRKNGRYIVVKFRYRFESEILMKMYFI